MSKACLPNELIHDILSHDLGQPELARLCRSSKLLSTIAKPLLYRSILIQSWRQLDQFILSASEEDVLQVERVDIVGKRNAWEFKEVGDLKAHFASLSEGEKKEKEAQCVENLLEGCLVDSNQVDSIYIHNVVEDPNVLWTDNSGGHTLLRTLLQRQYLPNLERLVLCDVTYTAPEPRRRLLRRFPPADLDNLHHIFMSDCDLFAELKLLVSPSYGSLDDFPDLLHLAVLDGTEAGSLRPSDKYAVVYISTRLSTVDEIVSVFSQLSEVADNFPKYSLEYLALPSTLKRRLLKSETTILEYLDYLGVAIRFDGELGRSIAPSSFFEHLKGKDSEEQDKEDHPDTDDSNSA
ncbi:uncharacterized protein JCM6883_006926 [Sporobolomyces salmoneus]|uniref:uncharacterized protein n=1 Tax=Sporobolomyces salmoneus TaxID=183962 RepID=UPI00317D0E66